MQGTPKFLFLFEALAYEKESCWPLVGMKFITSPPFGK